MTDLARTARVSSIGSEYNAFLYATIGADANGTTLSVLSAMARMNLDPWQEATNLAKSSANIAARRLASLIAAVPGGPADPEEPGMIAARLVKLLPNQARPILPILQSPKVLFATGVLAQLRMAQYVLFALIALVLATVWFAASRPPSAPPGPAHVSAAAQPASRTANNGRI